MTVLRPRWVWTPEGVREGLCVEVEGDRIAAVVPAERHPRVPEAPNRLLLPGMVNAHSHAFQRAFRGQVQWRAADRDDFWSWRDRMYTTANGLDPEGVEAVSALAFLEMAEAGFTHVGEFHYLHHQPDGTPYADPDELARRVIAAALSVGIRITLLRVAYGRAGIGTPLRPDQRRFGDRGPDEVLAAVARLGAHPDPRVRVGLAPHSIRAVPGDWITAFSAYRGPIHAHVSEQPAENEAALRALGSSPLEAFAPLLSERFTAVHLTHPLPGDVARLRAAGGAVCVCPSTELDLGDGLLPLEARTLPLSIGTDSHARIDPWAELRDLELHARALAGRRNVLGPAGADREALAAHLLRAGCRPLHPDGGGVVAPGAPADFVVLDLDRAAADGVPPLAAAAFCATPEWVDEVWVAGDRIVAGGRHHLRTRIRRAAAAALAA